MKNLTLGKHFKIFVPKDRPVRIGDRIRGWDDNCVVVKILERKKKEGKIPFYILRRWTDNKWVYKKANREDFETYCNRHNVVLLKSDDYIYKIYKIIREKAKQMPKKKPGPGDFNPKGELRGTHPKGVIFSEYAAPPELTADVMGNIKKWIVTENNTVSNIEKMVLKRKLKEFHERPYLKTIVEEVKGKPQGEEDLKKVKFPFYCTYKDSGHIIAGQVNRGWTWDKGQISYSLVSVNNQYNDSNTVCQCSSLKSLIDDWNIEICKGETKIWKEVGEYKKKE